MPCRQGQAAQGPPKQFRGTQAQTSAEQRALPGRIGYVMNHNGRRDDRSPAESCTGDGHGEKLSRLQERAVSALLSHSTLKAAARAVHVNPKTLSEWLKNSP